MPIYKKKVSTRDPRWHNRAIQMTSVANTPIGQDVTTDVIPLDDTEVICNGCNGNIYSPETETFGYLIYLGKRELVKDQPYDFYCDDCTKHSFPKAIEVTDSPGFMKQETAVRVV